jgi:hypothetical protein
VERPTSEPSANDQDLVPSEEELDELDDWIEEGLGSTDGDYEDRE